MLAVTAALLWAIRLIVVGLALGSAFTRFVAARAGGGTGLPQPG